MPPASTRTCGTRARGSRTCSDAAYTRAQRPEGRSAVSQTPAAHHGRQTRTVGVRYHCPVCEDEYEANAPHHRFCSDRCRLEADRRRRTARELRRLADELDVP